MHACSIYQNRIAWHRINNKVTYFNMTHGTITITAMSLYKMLYVLHFNWSSELQ